MSEKPQKYLLIEPHYLPSVSWMMLVARYDVVYLDISSNFVKASYRNRCSILGPNGLLTLSVPLSRSRHERDSMASVKISYEENWQKNHWMTLMTSYRRSAYFEYFEDSFQPLFIRRFELLMDVNVAFLSLLFKICNLKTEIRFTEKYIEPGNSDFDDYRNIITPKTKNPLQLEFDKYQQVFSDRFDFFSDLSIVDMIFNDGKINLLK